MDQERHLVLTSNGSSDTFPGNTPSDFTTQLAQPLNLEDGAYEVALAEFQFVRSQPTINQRVFTVNKPVGASNVRLPPTEVTSIQDLVKLINSALSKRQLSVIKFTFNTQTFKTEITIPANYSVELSDELAAVLGFANKVVAVTASGDAVSDLFQGAYHMFVHSDISEQIAVGDKMERLLGIVSIPRGSRSEAGVITKVFTNPMFVKIMNNRVDSVQVHIKDDLKKPVQFKLGPSIARLIIRKRKRYE